MTFEGQASNHDLILSAKNGDIKAFEELVTRHFGMVYAVAYARSRRRETAEDIAQEVFLRAFTCLPRIQSPEQFPKWLIRVTHNLANDWKRKEKVRKRLIPVKNKDTDEEEDVVKELPDRKSKDARETLYEKELDRALNQAIFALPINQREVVLLYYIEGLSQQKISDCLGIHQTTVGRLLHKSLEEMRIQLEPHFRDTQTSFHSSYRAVARTLARIEGKLNISMGPNLDAGPSPAILNDDNANWLEGLASAGSGVAIAPVRFFDGFRRWADLFSAENQRALVNTFALVAIVIIGMSIGGPEPLRMPGAGPGYGDKGRVQSQKWLFDGTPNDEQKSETISGQHVDLIHIWNRFRSTQGRGGESAGSPIFEGALSTLAKDTELPADTLFYIIESKEGGVAVVGVQVASLSPERRVQLEAYWAGTTFNQTVASIRFYIHVKSMTPLFEDYWDQEGRRLARVEYGTRRAIAPEGLPR